MKRIGVGVLLAMGLAAPAIAKDVTSQVVIRCDCLQRYAAWMCEMFGFFLC